MSGLYTNLWNGYLRMRASMQNDRRFAVQHQLTQEQWRYPSEIAELQAKRLVKLINHAREHSPFYQRRLAKLTGILDEHFTLDDLSQIPLLTRQDIQDHREEILAGGVDDVYPDSSGGSTGKPVNFYHDSEYKTFGDGCELLFLSWMGVAPGDKTAVFWGADRDFKELTWREKLMTRLKRVKMLNSFNMTEETLDTFLEEIEKWKPEYVIGYTSSLFLAAKRINASDRFTIRPRAVRSAAEMLYDFQRSEIERAFGMKLYNFYGSREVSHMAAECDQHDGLHVFASGRIIEIVDDDGKPLPAGETGNIAVTDLTNFGFPFIRYLNGDMAALSDRSCDCGRGYPLLDKIAGRTTDVITINGKYIHGEYFTHLFYGRPDVRQFQVVQEAADRLRIKVVARNDSFDRQEIEEAIATSVGGSVKVEWELVDEIPVTKSGKYRFTINNMS